jgi:hypothetical protein
MLGRLVEEWWGILRLQVLREQLYGVEEGLPLIYIACHSEENCRQPPLDRLFDFAYEGQTFLRARGKSEAARNHEPKEIYGCVRCLE